MTESWLPFDEADHHLPKYDHFFRRDEVSEVFGHPQELEDWLKEHCPNNFCYVWVWDHERNRTAIVDYLIGIPEELVMPLKLMTGIDPVSNSEFARISELTYNGDIRYRLHTTSNKQI